MKKAIVIGCSGSGKTTFALKLSEMTGLPLYHLDAIWHKADRTHITREDFDERLSEILDSDKWIIDGNYNRTLEARLEKCDTVFLFDLPTELCIKGAADRLFKPRVDIPWIESELDPSFVKKIEEFAHESLPKIYELLKKHGEGKQTVVFKSRKEAEKYLGGIC